jgi:AcrR family transcriptional regulator
MVIKSAAHRRVLHREELKVEIRDAARTIFVREGYQSFSMRKLAAAIGYSAAAIYLYFPSKEALFRSLVEESFARLQDSLRALTSAPARNPAERLREGLRLYVAWGLDHPDDYQIAFLLPVPTGAPYRVHQAFELLRTLVADCVPAGAGRREAVETSSRAVWAAIHGITSLLIQRPTFPWRSKARVVRQLIDNAVDGLTAPNRTRPRPKAI